MINSEVILSLCLKAIATIILPLFSYQSKTKVKHNKETATNKEAVLSVIFSYNMTEMTAY